MVILGLGTNIGNREEYLSEAIRMLGESVLTAMEFSPVYESEAYVTTQAPEAWRSMAFLNMAVSGETHLSPEQLLKEIKTIEGRVGRQYRGTWGPREVDIDILAYGHTVVDSPSLAIPHKELLNRPFALIPLYELVPNWRYPVSGPYFGKTAFELVSLCVDKKLTIKKTDIVLPVMA